MAKTEWIGDSVGVEIDLTVWIYPRRRASPLKPTGEWTPNSQVKALGPKLQERR